MSNMLDDLKKVIRECDYSNTYKMAWAKALVESSNMYLDSISSIVEISLYDIATKMFKYYWDQTIYFNLYQSAPNQPPIILQEVKKLIDLYQQKKDDFKPITFVRANQFIIHNFEKEFKSSIGKCISNIKSYVMPFFLNLEGKTYNFYGINKKENKIYISKQLLEEIYNIKQDLFDLINYRWSLMLENYNSCPRIAKKVRIMDDQEVKRKRPLTSFDKFLDLENGNHTCFICGKNIPDRELSRDHVIPWSYLYSDDLWNLVYVHKGCNSKKSNITPSDEAIEELKKRNLRLQKELHKEENLHSLSLLEEFDYAIANDFVDKFYLGCRGC